MIVRIRPEAPADIDAVPAVHTAAFAPAGSVDEPVTEAVLADLLRVDAAWAPRLTLVAEVDGVLAGAVTTSYGILAEDPGTVPGFTLRSRSLPSGRSVCIRAISIGQWARR